MRSTEIRRRFRYSIPPQALNESLPRPQILRELCLAAGIQLDLLQYRFSGASAAPEVNGTHADDSQAKDKKKKSKAAAPAASTERTTTFIPDDVLNVYPISKKTVFRVCSGIPQRARSKADQLFTT